MTTEDKNYIYFDINELDNYKILNCSKLGSTSNIYKYKNNQIIKLFKYPESIEKLNTIEHIKKLNLKSFITPNKFIFIDEQYYGYSMDYFQAETLIDIKDNIKYLTILKNIKLIDKDIETLTKNNIKINDLNFLNILYKSKNNKLKIIDLDEYTISNVYEKYILLSNKEEFKMDFFLSICDCFNKNINKEKINKLRKYILSDNNNDLSLYELFYNFKLYVEKIYIEEILTINDLRNVLRK